MVAVSDFDPTPPTAATLPAVVASLVVFAVTLVSTASVALSAAGAALVAYGTQNGARRFVTLGGGSLFAAVVFAGTAGADPRLTLFAGAAAVVAYDAGEHAVSLGHDVGSEARVHQSLLVHVASTAAVAVLVAAVAFGVYEFGPGSLPVGGLIALLVGGVFLAYALKD